MSRRESCGGGKLCVSYFKLQDNSLHIDLRALNKVQKISPHLVALGSGNDFGRVLEILPPEKYTLIHGNSLSVGLGGFIQGKGVKVDCSGKRLT
jgi:hypothetical protein